MKPIERVYEIIKYKHLSIRQFEIENGFGNGSIQSALKRNAALKDETLLKILKNYPEINPLWLFLGKGDMLIGNMNSKAEEPPIDYKKALSSFSEDEIMQYIIKNEAKFLGNEFYEMFVQLKYKQLREAELKEENEKLKKQLGTS